MMMKMMNCFWEMIDRRKAFSLVSSRNHYRRHSPSPSSDTPPAGFEPAQNLSSGLLEMKLCTCDNHYTTGAIYLDNRSAQYIWRIELDIALNFYLQEHSIIYQITTKREPLYVPCNINLFYYE